METDSQLAETSAAGAKRKRLTTEATKLLKDFAEHCTLDPDTYQRQHLLDQVRRLPGMWDMPIINTITTWFQRHRAAERKKSTQDDDSILFPSLSSEKLEVLRPLLRNNSSPTKEMIGIWAMCIKAEFEEVRKWVLYHQAKVAPREASEQSMSASPTAPHPHLPTPARSLSPVRVRGVSLPLIATKEESSPTGSPLLDTWPTHTADVSPTSLTRHIAVSADAVNTDELDELHPPFTRIPSRGSRPLCDVPATTSSSAMQLAKDINHVMASHHPSRKPPSTHAEFDAMFKPYEEMMTQFIRNVESGKLQHLGWEPTVSLP
ncbi:uncharacterized protein EDB91DRAFT_1082448 [Suillus paluster]|uniref:uncharacterized protein n=1 Tax=Suillus paluster TaxID=48578 RepID=UPI001B872767|nr:uncharacterized protein EDB91DRAFT_1082448 [Suillus paluster]KAG1739108.1 hypothetical protein EDB91DRAFT_1082448 [Suillus paluster]